jgi:protein ImuB
MLACIYSRSVPKSQQKPGTEDAETTSSLVDLAFTFSPLVEQTSADTVVLNVSGQDLLFGSLAADAPQEVECARNIATEIIRQSKTLNLKVNVAIAANVDIAIHAARLIKGVTIITPGDELLITRDFSIKNLDYSLVAIDEKRAVEIQETFALWGIRTFGDLARLPLTGVAERLGQEGVRLQKLVQAKSDRRLNLIRPPMGFAQSLELEHAITEVEPLSFVLSRLLNQLCANLNEYALATNELKLQLLTDTRLEYRVQSGSSDSKKSPSEVGTLNAANLYERTLTLPVPMRNPKTLLRLLMFEIEREPPQAPIVAVAITVEPIKPRASQTGLFIPLAPEPERLEITLARLAKLVGAENVGSPEILDTHRPDTFRMNRFILKLNHREHRGRNPQAGNNGGASNRNLEIDNRKSVIGFRIFRPPWPADVRTREGKPMRIDAPSGDTRSRVRVRGQIVCASGPWRGSGDWWRTDVWARDEWDIAVADPKSEEGEVLCLIYRDLTTEQWFVAGIYD